MLIDHIKHALVCAISAIKNLAFSVQDKLLKIKRNSLSNTEIFRILRHADLHFFAGPKEVINGITAGKNDSEKLGYVDFLFAEIPRRYTLKPYKWLKIKFQIVFSGKLKVR
jgi:hypothetical protein